MKRILLVYFLLVGFLITRTSQSTKWLNKNKDQQATLPVVMWHGMGDTCCNPLSMGSIKKIIESTVPGISVTSLEIGGNIVEDFESGYFRNANDQIDYVCDLLQSDPTWANGYNGLGFSQGGLLLRGLAERCPSPPMVNLISIGGPQQGVFGLPHCPGAKNMCDQIRLLLNYVAYEPFVQSFLVQAEYWHDSVNEELYKHQSVYLGDINNERDNKTDVYKENLKKLANLVLVMFTQDTMVVPKESEWFGFYHPGQRTTIFNLTDSPLYKEDWIGLKSLDESGKLHLLSVDGDHLQFERQWFIDSIITPYLNISIAKYGNRT